MSSVRLQAFHAFLCAPAVSLVLPEYARLTVHAEAVMADAAYPAVSETGRIEKTRPYQNGL